MIEDMDEEEREAYEEYEQQRHDESYVLRSTHEVSENFWRQKVDEYIESESALKARVQELEGDINYYKREIDALERKTRELQSKIWKMEIDAVEQRGKELKKQFDALLERHQKQKKNEWGSLRGYLKMSFRAMIGKHRFEIRSGFSDRIWEIVLGRRDEGQVKKKLHYTTVKRIWEQHWAAVDLFKQRRALIDLYLYDEDTILDPIMT